MREGLTVFSGAAARTRPDTRRRRDRYRWRMPFRRTVFIALVLCAAQALAASAYNVYVSNERGGDVTVIDGTAGVVTATWPVGKRPRGIHLSPDGRTLYVAVSGSPIVAPGAHAERAQSAEADKADDGIVVVDTTSGKVVRRLVVGSDPEQFAVSPDGGRLIVSNEDEATASCWDAATGHRVFATKVSEEPEGVTIRPDGREVYVTCEQRGDVFVLQADTGAPLATMHVRGRPRSVAFLPDGSRAYIPAEGEAGVSVIDTATHAIRRTLTIPGKEVMPMCAVAAPDGTFVYVSTGRGNSIAVIDVKTETIASVMPVGRRPWGIALSPDGRTLFSANGKSDDVSVVDLATCRELRRIQVGRGPWGIAIATH